MIINRLDWWQLTRTFDGLPTTDQKQRRKPMNTSALENRAAPVLLAALRVVSGLLFLAHGLVKVAGFPAGAQPGQQALFGLMGIGGMIEIVAGALLIVGFLTRPAAFNASGEKAVAYWMFHAPASMYPAVNGGDAAILFSFIFLYVAAAGAGAFSIDALINRASSKPTSNLGSLAWQ
jgi:putative oxidoreductase